ncbi:hypothetical protein LOK49_LG15G02579 [Camellia lanceoleosa]|uniref:Uncharacterized protein n=1 Tax=Camellia lanceoleosa TaxID=1840588 RepID=A0ACC0F4J2_9ERIC|nr:hypothetical protein LOK49_LG15G02579 [Camellia lanceoleosa]
MALEMSMWMSMPEADMLMKVGMFVVVQALVYLILSNSSDIFSKDKVRRSLTFKPARSVTICRLLAFISDTPQGGDDDASPSLHSPTQEYPMTTDDEFKSSSLINANAKKVI